MDNNIALIVAIAVVICVILFQLWNFNQTRLRIKELKSFFPSIDSLDLKMSSITTDVLKSKSKLKEFIKNIPSKYSDEEGENEEYMDITLISLKNNNQSTKFSSIISRTNEYLCKNVGTSADFDILKGICEHQIDALENEIHSSLNVPLYIGLAGTFVGIITGLWGVDFSAILASNGNMNGLQHLLYGVMAAMGASLVGLGLTVYNSAFSYGKTMTIVDAKKEDYYDFIRRELMPVLSNSMASSLNSLKGVLGHFVDKFGKNLNAYADSAELLNDNLEKQHLVLEEINKLSLTRTANKIAETFVTLKDSAESLYVFKTYQEQLNTTIKGVTDAASKIDAVLSRFDEFGAGLSVVVSNQNKAATLQQEFKEAIETHFPTGSEGRDIWRKEFDLLMTDAKHVSDSLSMQLTASTEYIKKFVSGNRDFFESFDKMKEVIATLVQYTQVQAECYKDLKSEILNLRKDYKDAQIENIDLNKSILMAIDTMTKSIKDINVEKYDNEK